MRCISTCNTAVNEKHCRFDNASHLTAVFQVETGHTAFEVARSMTIRARSARMVRISAQDVTHHKAGPAMKMHKQRAAPPRLFCSFLCFRGPAERSTVRSCAVISVFFADVPAAGGLILDRPPGSVSIPIVRRLRGMKPFHHLSTLKKNVSACSRGLNPKTRKKSLSQGEGF